MDKWRLFPFLLESAIFKEFLFFFYVSSSFPSLNATELTEKKEKEWMNDKKNWSNKPGMSLCKEQRGMRKGEGWETGEKLGLGRAGKDISWFLILSLDVVVLSFWRNNSLRKEGEKTRNWLGWWGPTALVAKRQGLLNFKVWILDVVLSMLMFFSTLLLLLIYTILQS